MSAPTSIAGASWLADPRLGKVFAAIARDGDEVWVVGGAVRNTLMGLPVADVDLATTALPEAVMTRARAAHLKPVPTGIAHGTVTVVVEGHPFEITTLRKDVESHGRHATVEFGRDWEGDAHRRDFTVNALYVSPDGLIHDFVGGIADAEARRIRFIGEPRDRIEEDYLRILRFFRFHAAYGHGAPDADGLAACTALQSGLDRLSAERIGQELKKLVIAPGAPATVTVMATTGILQRVLGHPGHLARFKALHDLAAAGRLARKRTEAPLLLAALAGDSPDDARQLAQRLRLANAERERMAVALAASAALGPALPDAPHMRRLIHAHGGEGARDGLLLAAAVHGWTPESLEMPLELARDWQPPAPPVRGRDLLALGIADGPGLGDLVRQAEKAWIDSDFAAGRAEVLATLGLSDPKSK